MRKNKDLFSIFPADAGVNLSYHSRRWMYDYIPRGCGGEPKIYIKKLQNATIFPADAGVNLIKFDFQFCKLHIPRGCGGEPRLR